MSLLLLYLSLVLFFSFLCSIMEAVLLSTPPSFIAVKIEEKKSWAKKLKQYKKNIDRPLSAILSLNTIAHTVGATGVGAQAVKVFGETYLGVVSAILTLLILVVTEIIPKTIGARFYRELAKYTTILIRFIIFITYPLVYFSSIITKVFNSQESEGTVSREEMSAIASLGEEEGVFTKEENKIIQNLLKLKSIRVNQILTPRVVLVSVNEEMTVDDFLKNKSFLNFSRIPVFCDDEENIIGYVFRQTVFEKLAEDKHKLKLKDVKRDIYVIPNTITLFSLWEKLLENKEHIALVVDEYGGVDGVVTMEDIIETLLGIEILDEKDTITDMQKFAKERWKAKQTKYKLLEI